MLESCTLADTGWAQTPLLVAAIILVVAGIGLFFAGRRYGFKGSFLVIAFVFVAVLALAAKPVSAQSTDCTSSTNEQPVTGLQLVNDIQAGEPGTTVEVAVVANDLFPGGDPIDWATLDLIPETPEVDSYTEIYYPSDSSYICGNAFFDYDGYGENIQVYISSDCVDGDDNHIPLVSPLTFRYTAKTQGGVQAPTPATVAITLEGVYAFDHSVQVDSIGENVTGDAVTFVGTIDPDSVDLDPSTPGRQTSLFVPDVATPDVDMTIEVDNTGVVTATLTSRGDLDCNSGTLGDYPYTLENTMNTVSNQALITITYTFNCG